MLLSREEHELFLLLDKSRDVRYYSYSLSSILDKMKITKQQLIELGLSLEAKLGHKYKLNIFDWTCKSKTYTFVGFEYRRKDYERDKLLGTNVVEKNIKNECY